ncbi:MAG TPA: hypothetical protein VIU34_33355, partial [Steroidobacter sp.]
TIVGVSIAFFLNYERHSRNDAFSKLHENARATLLFAESLRADIDYTILSAKFLFASPRRDRGFQQLHDQYIAGWVAERERLKHRIQGYARLKATLDQSSVSWSDFDERKSELITGADEDSRLRARLDREEKQLKDQLAARRLISPPRQNGLDFDANYFDSKERAFRQVGDRWVEYPEYAPGRNFTFREQRRDEQYVYLQDPSRSKNGDPKVPMLVRVPVHGGMAQWTYEDSTWTDLFVINSMK